MKETIILPEGFNFECMGCGACCRDWTIHVDRGTYEKLTDTELYDTMRTAPGGPLPFQEEPDGSIITGRTPDGSCVFLDGKTRCSIHGKVGYREKPLGCRQFPFKLKLTPDGVYAGVSFYCKSCRENSGKPLEHYRREIEAWLEEYAYSRTGDLPLFLDEGLLIDWKAYTKVEDLVKESLEKFTDCEEAVWDALVRVSLLTIIAKRRSLEKLSAEDITRIAGEAGKIPVERDDTFRQLGMFYTLIVIGVLESSTQEEARQITDAAIGGGVFNSKTFNRDISMAGFSPYYLGNPCEWKHRLIKRFINHLVFRKFLAGSEPVLFNLSALFTAYGLVEFYLYLGAYQEGRKSPEEKDLHFAYGLVEKGFSAHTMIMNPFFKLFAQGFKEQLQILV